MAMGQESQSLARARCSKNAHSYSSLFLRQVQQPQDMAFGLLHHPDAWGVGVRMGDINGSGDAGTWGLPTPTDSNTAKMRVGRTKEK